MSPTRLTSACHSSIDVAPHQLTEVETNKWTNKQHMCQQQTNKQTNQGSMCAGGSVELHSNRVQYAMHQSMQKGFGDVSEVHQKSVEFNNAGSYSDSVTYVAEISFIKFQSAILFENSCKPKLQLRKSQPWAIKPAKIRGKSLLHSSTLKFLIHTCTQGPLTLQAQVTFEEGIMSILTIWDFTQIFDAYAEFLESVISTLMDMDSLANPDVTEIE
jgi:hypothetical protein